MKYTVRSNRALGECEESKSGLRFSRDSGLQVSTPLISGLPLLTLKVPGFVFGGRSILILCSSIYAFQLLTGMYDVRQVCLHPRSVMESFQGDFLVRFLQI